MNKMLYVRPVTDIEIQVYTENPLMAGSNPSGPKVVVPEGFREGIPSMGGSALNPSFIKRGEYSNSTLWDDSESDFK